MVDKYLERGEMFVSAGTKNLAEVVTLLWTFRLPWAFANHTPMTPWITQFAFGFYGVKGKRSF